MKAEPECSGTLLAPAASVGDPRPADVWRGQRNRFLIEDARTTNRWIHAVGGLIQLVNLLVFLDAGYPTWRLGAVAGVFLTFALIQRAWIHSSYDAMSVRPGVHWHQPVGSDDGDPDRRPDRRPALARSTEPAPALGHLAAVLRTPRRRPLDRLCQRAADGGDGTSAAIGRRPDPAVEPLRHRADRRPRLEPVHAPHAGRQDDARREQGRPIDAVPARGAAVRCRSPAPPAPVGRRQGRARAQEPARGDQGPGAAARAHAGRASAPERPSVVARPRSPGWRPSSRLPVVLAPARGSAARSRSTSARSPTTCSTVLEVAPTGRRDAGRRRQRPPRATAIRAGSRRRCSTWSPTRSRPRRAAARRGRGCASPHDEPRRGDRGPRHRPRHGRRGPRADRHAVLHDAARAAPASASCSRRA